MGELSSPVHPSARRFGLRWIMRAVVEGSPLPAGTAGLDAATLSDVLRVANRADFDRWQEQIRRTGGCSDPIRLIGATKTIDPATKTVLHAYTTETEPGGMLRIACGNRRASRCPACAWTYAGDTYHLIRAGLVGDPDKGTPRTIRDHPRVFATLTAPSFGPVHNRPGNRPCRCGIRHGEDAPEFGTPLDPDSYDYAGAVLWNNHASELWRYFTIYLRREIAKRAGLTQRQPANSRGSPSARSPSTKSAGPCTSMP